ncbi:MAG: hypothetical protein Phog2KO_14370 [Phototrophicaceae bacterium]
MKKEIIALLKSSDPKDRAKGIKQLAVSNDPDTMKVLGAVYKKETNPSVKKLASQVARELKDRETSDIIEHAPVQSQVVITNEKRDPEQAKAYLDRAMSALIDLKTDDAWKWAQEAFLANPDYTEDDYAVGLAAEITGVDRSIAVETLMQNRVAGRPEKAKRGASKNSDVAQASWGQALTGVAIYSILVGIGTYLPIMLLGRVALFLANVDSLVQSFAETGLSPEQFISSLNIIAIITAISSVVAAAIGLLIQYGFVHISATNILGGRGYFTNLLYNLRVPLITQFLAQAAIVGIILFTFVSVLPNDPAVWEQAELTGDYSAFEAINTDTGFINILNGLNALVSLGFTIWISMTIGKTYDFGGVKGCMSIIISAIIMGVVMCGCYFTVIMSLTSFLN